MRPSVECDERQAVEFEHHGQDATLGSRPAFALTRDVQDSRVRYDRYVKIGGLFSLIVKGQKRGDLRHGFSPNGSGCWFRARHKVSRTALPRIDRDYIFLLRNKRLSADEADRR